MPDNISANGRNFLGEGGRERASDAISANGQNLRMPDDISANGRNYVTRIILREINETM